MSRSNRTGTVNPFAALDSDEEDDDQIEPSKIPQAISDEPVHFAIKGVHWTKEKVYAELKNFNVQWIKKDRAGVLYLQFESEIEGVKVVEWLRQKHRLNFTVSKTALKKDPKCFLCHREDHWGPQCTEGLFASFPREIICLIASNLHITELLRLKVVTRSFNSAIATMRSLYLEDPYYDKYGEQKQSRKFRSHFLRTFMSLEELSLRNYDTEAIKGPAFNIIDYILQCKSLRSLTLRSCELTDLRTEKESPHFTKLLALTKLTKLIAITREVMSDSSLQLLGNLTNLVDLGLTITSDDIFDNSLDEALLRLPGLTRLELKNSWSWAKEARLILSPENMTRLVSFKVRNFPAGIYFGVDMKKLEELNVDRMKDWYPLVAPNLTRLICGSPKIMDHIHEYSSLKYVKLDFQTEEKVVITLPNLEVLEISKWFKDADFNGCTNLKKLSVKLGKKDFTLLVPPSIVHLAIDPSQASSQAIKAICELPNLENLEIARPLLPSDVLKALAQITTLRTLSFRNIGTNVALNEDFVTGLSNFTQLKVLDLIRFDTWNTDAYQKSKPLILKLSQNLPNTRILHGVLYNRDTLVKYDDYRPNHGSHCPCTRCEIIEQEELEEYKREMDEENRAAMHVPKKFNKFWYN